MDRMSRFIRADWPWVIALLFVALVAGCQDGSGPGLVSGPEAQSSLEKKPPQPPPTPAEPAIAYAIWAANDFHLQVMDDDGSSITTIFESDGHMISSPSWSPDGSTIAFEMGFDLWLIDVEVVGGVPTGSNARVLLDRSSSLFFPAWSPLGDQIAFVDIQLNTIETIPAVGGATSLIYTSATGSLGYPTLSPGADLMAFTEGGAIRVLDLSTNEVTTVLDAEWGQQFGINPGHLDWARTQDALAFGVGAVQSGDTAIYILQIPSGEPVFIVEGRFPTWSPDDSKLCFNEGRNSAIIDLATQAVVTFRHTDGLFQDWRRF